MVVSLFTAECKLNDSNKEYKKYLVILSTEGVLLVDNGLFSISFKNSDFIKSVDYRIVSLIGDICL